MKKNLASILRATAAAIILTASPVAHCGFFDILRGDTAAKEGFSEGYQKVAFVGEADVKEVRGTAEVMVGNNKWMPLSVQTHLKVGTTIRTGADSSVLLKMRASQSFVKVSAQTMLRLAPLAEGWNASILTGDDANKGYAVRAVRGTAEVKLADGWVPLNVSMKVQPGALIKAANGTTVDLFSRDYGVVRIDQQGETILPFERLAGSRVLGPIAPSFASN